MVVRTTNRDVLTVADLGAERLELVLELAARMKEEPLAWRDALRGETAALIFEKPSTRTRASFAAAAARLGMSPLALRPDELQLGRGETVADTARVLSRYAAAIAVRTFSQELLEEFAAASSAPVINALTDSHHPCQALADLLTLREQFGTLAGLRVAYIGDGANNVAHSLLEAGALTGMEIAVGSPLQHMPDPVVVAGVRELAAEHGAVIEIWNDPVRAVRGADAVYTDVWVSMGEEAERAERLARFRRYGVTEQLLGQAKREAVFLHCLPAHRGEEVDAAVIDGPQSLVWQQAANRMPTEQALLYALVTGDWLGGAAEH
jgi:ornithine carbamoyltransferase